MRCRIVALRCAALALSSGAASADPIADFYKGKHHQLDPERRVPAAAMPAMRTRSRRS